MSRRAGALLGRSALWALAAGAAALELLLLGILLVAGARARFVSPPPSLLAVDRNGAFLGELAHPPTGGAEVDKDDELGYWPLDEVPPRVAAAAIALEDRRFAAHPGVDPLAVLRAVGQNLHQRRRVSGASTLAMQVARMQSPGGRGYLRKLTEAATACFLTARYGRDAVLRQYLTLVPYGNRIHGIAYAARRYLAKPVADLSWAEIAFLSSLPQAPGRMSPYEPQGRARALRRGERLLGRLAAQGLLSPAELDLGRRELRGLQLPYLERRPPAALHALLELERRVAASGAPSGIVRSTLDLEVQRDAAWETYRAVREWESRGAGNAALLVVDARTREVLAWVGSADYADAARAGAIDYARVARSPGSTLKPFLYALALERGVLTPATVLDDLGRGPGGIADADDRFLGPLLPRVALANSRNVPAVAVLQRLGVPAGFGFLRELGLARDPAGGERYGLGLAIGGLPVTLADLARAYTVLAGDGTLADLRWVRDARPAPAERVLSEDTAREITLFLADPQARLPSFPRLGASEYPFPVAVKTGTSSNFRDAWTVAWSARYLVAAWVGHPSFRPMNRLTGYRSAAELVQRVLLRLHRDDRDGLHDLGFPPPRGAEPVRLCALTGRRSTAACDRTVLEWLRPGEAPAEDCAAHRRREVDIRNGLLATAATPAAFRETRTFLELEPRYAEWLHSQKLPLPPAGASPLAAPVDPGRAAAARLRITSPEDGVRLVRDPELPQPLATLALRAVVDPPVAQVVWYVDGLPYEVSDRPYTARWPLRPGAHRFQARLPFQGAASREVSVTVE